MKKNWVKHFRSRKFLAAKIINHVIDHAESEKRKFLVRLFRGAGGLLVEYWENSAYLDSVECRFIFFK